MSRFARKCLWFCLPFGALLSLPVLIFLRAGEFLSVDEVIDSQSAAEAMLYGQSYSDPAKPYKLRSARRREPELMALGSSRIMQLRAHFFREPREFYNAGGAVATAWDFRHFLSLLEPAARGELMLVALDPWSFNPRRTGSADAGKREFLVEDTALNIIQRRWHTVYRDLWQRKIDLRRVIVAGRGADVGLNAVQNARGFRADGSYSYGAAISAPDFAEHWDPEFRDTLSRIATGSRRFEWSDEIAPAAVREVERFLAACSERGISVVGFLPPFAPSVWRALQASGHYGYLARIEPALRPSFEAQRFPLFDFSDPAILDATDAEFIDGFHGSERTYARLLLRAAEGSPELERRLDRAGLARRLARSGRFEVPER